MRETSHFQSSILPRAWENQAFYFLGWRTVVSVPTDTNTCALNDLLGDVGQVLTVPKEEMCHTSVAQQRPRTEKS